MPPAARHACWYLPSYTKLLRGDPSCAVWRFFSALFWCRSTLSAAADAGCFCFLCEQLHARTTAAAATNNKTYSQNANECHHAASGSFSPLRVLLSSSRRRTPQLAHQHAHASSSSLILTHPSGCSSSLRPGLATLTPRPAPASTAARLRLGLDVRNVRGRDARLAEEARRPVPAVAVLVTPGDVRLARLEEVCDRESTGGEDPCETTFSELVFSEQSTLRACNAFFTSRSPHRPSVQSRGARTGNPNSASVSACPFSHPWGPRPP